MKIHHILRPSCLLFNTLPPQPSDLAPATATVMEKLTSYLDPDAFLVVNGGVPESTELLKERFDHIFYTGSINVRTRNTPLSISNVYQFRQFQLLLCSCYGLSIECDYKHVVLVQVGKIVYAAAQKNLTPVVLELGGKSPVYLDSNVDVDISTKRILWGKWVNAGQTCVAPDYVLCHESVYDRFMDKCKKVHLFDTTISLQIEYICMRHQAIFVYKYH